MVGSSVGLGWVRVRVRVLVRVRVRVCWRLQPFFAQLAFVLAAMAAVSKARLQSRSGSQLPTRGTGGKAGTRRCFFNMFVEYRQ